MSFKRSNFFFFHDVGNDKSTANMTFHYFSSENYQRHCRSFVILGRRWHGIFG